MVEGNDFKKLDRRAACFGVAFRHIRPVGRLSGLGRTPNAIGHVAVLIGALSIRSFRTPIQARRHFKGEAKGAGVPSLPNRGC